MEKKTKKINGLQIRLLVSALLFLLVFALNQFTETKNWLQATGIFERIESFEDIYRLEDEGIVWYNSFANKNK